MSIRERFFEKFLSEYVKKKKSEKLVYLEPKSMYIQIVDRVVSKYFSQKQFGTLIHLLKSFRSHPGQKL